MPHFKKPKRLQRRRAIVSVSTIIDTDENGKRINCAGWTDQQTGKRRSLPVAPNDGATVLIESAPSRLLVGLRGGKRDKPERMLERAPIPGLKVYGHTRQDGITYVTVQCPVAQHFALRSLTYVLSLEETRGTIGMTGTGASELRPLPSDRGTKPARCYQMTESHTIMSELAKVADMPAAALKPADKQRELEPAHTTVCLPGPDTAPLTGYVDERDMVISRRLMAARLRTNFLTSTSVYV